MKVFSLHELNSSIRRAFEQNFGGRFWVTAETSGIKSPPQGGHFYFELLEKGEREGQILARSRAVMWRASVGSLLAKFESATGQAFTNGLQVQLLVGKALLFVVGSMNAALHWVAHLQGASIEGLHPNVLQVLLWYVFLFCVWYLFSFFSKRTNLE